MYISKVQIKNFRNLQDFKIELREKMVLIGENGVGKTNFFEALRFALDSDYRRQLDRNDFTRGVVPFKGTRIEVHIWFTGFNSDKDQDLLACAHDCRVSDEGEPLEIKFSTVYRPRPQYKSEEALGEDQYEVVRFARDDETNDRGAGRFRSYVKMVFIPALRDMDRDMQSWRFSPMRRLVEQMRLTQNAEFVDVAKKVGIATEGLHEVEPIDQLQKSIQKMLGRVVGNDSQINPVIGLLPSNPDDLQKMLTLFVEFGLPLERASLGLSNVLYLVTWLIYLERLRNNPLPNQKPQYTFLAVEEPEAHLHPHLQRLVFTNVFNQELPILVSTHSSTIVSLAKPEWFAHFKYGSNGTVAASTSKIAKLDPKLRQDLSRFLDATRGEVVFARGVLLVEGDSEVFLVPEMARNLEKLGEIPHALDALGISICSVFGTDFEPYVCFLGHQGLDIPLSVITDGDAYVGLKGKVKALQNDEAIEMMTKQEVKKMADSNNWKEVRERLEVHGYGHYSGLKRGIELVKLIDIDQVKVLEARYEANDWIGVRVLLQKSGIFVNETTLEGELLESGYGEDIVDVYGELGASEKQQTNMKMDIKNAYVDKIINRIETSGMGKGRFSQRLAGRVNGKKIPPYIREAIDFVYQRLPTFQAAPEVNEL